MVASAVLQSVWSLGSYQPNDFLQYVATGGNDRNLRCRGGDVFTRQEPPRSHAPAAGCHYFFFADFLPATAALKPAPAVKRGTVAAASLISAPVCGLRPAAIRSQPRRSVATNAPGWTDRRASRGGNTTRRRSAASKGFHPAGHDFLVGQGEQVLQVQQPGHEPGGHGRTAGVGDKPGTEHAPTR